MSKAKQNIASAVRQAISETVAQMGFELWDVEYVKDGAFWYLRIIIDSEKGIDIADCEAVHRAIDPLIDQLDPIEDQYFLEVSSPGVERELKNPEHFERFLSCPVVVKLFAAQNGKKQYIGRLLSYDENGISISCDDGEQVRFDKKTVSRVHLYYDFSTEKED